MFNVLGGVVVAVLWTATIVDLLTLPPTIPMHFDLANHPNRYGSKAEIVALPLIETLVWIVLLFSQRMPQHFNYPFRIDEAKRGEATEATQTFVAAVGICIPLMGLLLERGIAAGARGGPIGPWLNAVWGLIPAIVVLAVVYLVYVWQWRRR